jgi:heterodisulfide reductase subunit B
MIPARFPQFEASTLKVLDALNVSLDRMSGCTCCPEPLSMQTLNKDMWYSVAARNISIAESKGLDILTVCNGCNETLFEANKDLKADRKLRLRINQNLKEIGKSFEGNVAVKSFLRVLYEDIGLDAVKKHVKVPLNDAKIAVHYGCHIFPELEDFDDAQDPHSLKDLVRALGANAVSYSGEMTCCAAFARPINEDVSLEFTEKKLRDIASVGAECLVVMCPYCFLQFDLGQVMISRKWNKTYNIPVVYCSQLVGLAMGFSPHEMGLHLHMVKVDDFAKKIGASGTY